MPLCQYLPTASQLEQILLDSISAIIETNAQVIKTIYSVLVSITLLLDQEDSVQLWRCCQILLIQRHFSVFVPNLSITFFVAQDDRILRLKRYIATIASNINTEQ